MRRRRRILAAVVVAVAMLAAAGAVVHHFTGRGPPEHLAKRLPPLSAMPKDLTSDQRAAIRLLYSPNPNDRLRGVMSMGEAKVPEELQVPYLVALLADDPALQDERPPSPVEAWFWRLMGTELGKADVAAASLSRLTTMAPRVTDAMLRAIRTEENAGIRNRLVGLLTCIPLNVRRMAPASQPSWHPPAEVLDALVEFFRSDRDAEVRQSAIVAFSFLKGVERELLIPEKTTRIRDEVDFLPDEPTPIDPRHRDALVAAARNDKEAAVRMRALQEIAVHLGPEAVPVLVDAMADDTEGRVREHASWLLTAPGGMVEVGDSLFARPATWPRLQRPHLVQAMIDALRQDALHTRGRSPEIRTALRRTLEDLTGENFGQDAEKWQTWLDAHQADFK
jgi:HEAT repeat protein